jgi:hypothetical protein
MSMFEGIRYWIGAIMQLKLKQSLEWEKQVRDAIFLNLRYSVFSSEFHGASDLSIPPEYAFCTEVNEEVTVRIRQQGYGKAWDIDGMASEELANILRDFGFDQHPIPCKDEAGTLMAQVQRVERAITHTMQIRFSVR